jgi:membrane protein DedA with SNARE-associated domain
VAFVVGTLASRGYFNVYLAYGIFVVKDCALDGVYYYAGRFASGSSFVATLLARAHVTSAQMDHVRFLWNRHGWRTMWVGKLSWGLSPAFLAAAGMVTVPATIFFRYAIGVALAQYGVLLVLGYYGGHAIETVSQTLRVLGYILAGSAVAAFVYWRHRLRP